MNTEIDDTDDLRRLIADDLQALGTISVQQMVAALMKASAAHGGRWPTHATGSYDQVTRWSADVMEWSRVHDRPITKTLHIMSTRIIERPGPITLIWSERLP